MATVQILTRDLSYRNGYLYGTTYGGGAHCNPGCGTVFAAHLDHGLAVENVIYSFCNTGNPSTCIDGAYPIAGLVADQNGNLYGTTQAGGTSTCDTQYVTCGNVFELSYNGQAWNLTVLYSFRRVARISTLPEG